MPLKLRLNAKPKGKPTSLLNGRTQNVSAGGAFIQTDDRISLAIGSELEVDIELPHELSNGMPNTHVAGVARVVRIERTGEGAEARQRVALEFDDLDVSFEGR